jgi:uncharacterized glyoxalase superfamily metalloenzyme YdcJ
MSAPTNLHRDIGRMEGKLDAVLSEMRGGLRLAHQRLDEHQKEIELLKQEDAERHGAIRLAKWLWGAILALLGIFLGLLGSHLK